MRSTPRFFRFVTRSSSFLRIGALDWAAPFAASEKSTVAVASVEWKVNHDRIYLPFIDAKLRSPN